MALIRCDHAANGPFGLSWREPGTVVDVSTASLPELSENAVNKLIADLMRLPGFSEVQPGDPFLSEKPFFSEVEKVEMPPKAGPNGSAAAWRAYAASNGVEVGEDARRDEIIAALEAADIPVE